MATAQPQTNQTSERRDFRKEVTESIAKMLEEGVAPWQKPWDASVAGTLALPFNPTSNNSYRGGNAIHLLATAMRKGYEDPRWMTYKQATENDWQVRKGEKGTQIEFWEIKRADNENPSSSPATNPESGRRDDQSSSQFIHRVYTVFNAAQIEGVPAHEPKHRSPFEIVGLASRFSGTPVPESVTIKPIELSTPVHPTRFIFLLAKPSMEHRATTEPPFMNLPIGRVTRTV